MNRIRLTNPFKTSMLLFLGGIMSCNKPIDNANSKILDKLPFNAGDVEPKLGEAYDSLIQELRNTPVCVEGTAAKLTSHSSSINLQQNIQSQDMLREFTGEVQGTPRLVFFQGGVGAGFFRSLDKKNSVLSVVYGVKIHAGGEKLDGVKLNPSFKDLGSIALFQKCGDSYVMQINRGGILAITLNFDFGSLENKLKWQAKLKLNSSLGELSKDLIQKIAKDGIDGSLTIQVNQSGGSTIQPLLAVRTCSLGTREDYAICKAQLNQIIKYASEKFPREVQSNPAILNYVTASLQTLGVYNLPPLDKAIIQTRNDLENLKQTSNLQVNMMEKAANVGLPFEDNLRKSINQNKIMIEQSAAECFKYTLSDKGVDWRKCMTGFSHLKTGLNKISAEATTINQLNIRANIEIGNSVVNPYASPINVAYKAAQQGTNHSPCAPPRNRGNILNPREKAGALLVRKDGIYQAVEGGGNASIYPGNSLNFAFNNPIETYAANHGSQTVYWRCTNCSASNKILPTHRLVVKSYDEIGTIFNSHKLGVTEYQVVANGRWRSSSHAQWSDAKGGQESCTRNCPVPTAPKQALVMKRTSSTIAIGGLGCLQISDQKNVTFVMNDESGRYDDNQGALEIIIQERKCGISSHPVNLPKPLPSVE